MSKRLDPADFYMVRFIKPIDPDTGVIVGDEGLVIEHDVDGLLIEVAPWDVNGEPVVIVGADFDCVEPITRTLDEIAKHNINKRWEDMERWLDLRKRGQK